MTGIRNDVKLYVSEGSVTPVCVCVCVCVHYGRSPEVH